MELLIRDKRISAIFRCKRVNLANGVIFGVEGAFKISDNLIQASSSYAGPSVIEPTINYKYPNEY